MDLETHPCAKKCARWDPSIEGVEKTIPDNHGDFVGGVK